MAQRSDAELLAAVSTDTAAFGLFYRRNLPAVAGYFMARTRDPGLSADLTAETFAAALAASHRYRPDSPATSWLYLTARRTLIQSLRGGQVDSRRRRALGMSPTPLTDEDVEHIRLIWSSQEHSPLALLEDLPPQVREVLSAPIARGPRRVIGFELRRSELVLCGWPEGSTHGFFDQTERKLMDATARGAHLPWRHRTRWRSPLGIRVHQREGSAC